MKTLKATVLLLALLLAACEGLTSPTDPGPDDGGSERVWPNENQPGTDEPE